MHAAYIEKPDIFSGSAAKLIFNCMFVPTNRRKRRADAQLLSLQPESVCSNLRFLQVSSHLSEEKTMKSTGKQRTKTQVAVTHLKKKEKKKEEKHNRPLLSLSRMPLAESVLYKLTGQHKMLHTKRYCF